MTVNRMLVTGDTHGEKERWLFLSKKYLQTGDILFVCGDFGYVFFPKGHRCYRESEEFLDKMNRMAKRKSQIILFCDGNHENFDRLSQFPVEIWNGGKIHRVRENIIHLMRGQIYEINSKKIFVMGGGYSIDKAFREEGRSWWPQEMPSEEECDEARVNLKKHGYKVDYIITHTAPEDSMNIFHLYHEQEQAFNFFLEWIRENVTYKHWYFGHLHQDEDLWRHQTVLWFGVRDMKTNEVCEVAP